jgi:hypothetical protein
LDKVGGMSMEITKGKRVALIIIISLFAPFISDNIWNYNGIEFFLQYAMLFAITLFFLLPFIINT